MISENFPMTLGGSPVASEDHLLTKIENGIYMSPASVSYLILHCSATRETRDYTAEQLKHDHLARGFLDVGYHFYIRRDGTLTQHRRLNEVGAHCRPFNRCCTNFSPAVKKAKVLRLITLHHNISLIFYVSLKGGGR